MLAALVLVAPTTAVAAPTNTALPIIASAADQSGHGLILVRPGMRIACVGGAWSGAIGQYPVGWVLDGNMATIFTPSLHLVQVADVGHTIQCLMEALALDGTTDRRASPAVMVAPAGSPLPTTGPTLSAPSPIPQGVITCDPGAWDDPQALLSIRWLRDGVDVGRAVAQGRTYTVLAGDLTHTIACVVSASLPGATSPDLSTAAVAIVAAAPPALVDPSATPTVAGAPGLPVGSTVFCSGPLLAGPYVIGWTTWSVAGREVVGAHSGWLATTPAMAGATIACSVTYDDLYGYSLTVASPPTTIGPLVRPRPVVPSIASVGPAVTPGDWTYCSVASNDITVAFTFGWRRDGRPIAGASASEHFVTASDVGHRLTCTSVAHGLGGTSASATSAAITPVPLAAPRAAGVPFVVDAVASGSATCGNTGAVTGRADVTVVEWTLDGTVVGAGPTVALPPSAVGRQLACRGRTSNAAGTVVQTSPAVTVTAVEIPPAAVIGPFQGPPGVGTVVQCPQPVLPNVTVVFDWKIDGTVVAGESRSGYLIRPEDEGHMLNCEATQRNAAGTAFAAGPAVRVAPPARPAPQVRVDPTAGGETCSVSRDSSDGAIVDISWFRDDVEIPGEKGADHRTTIDDAYHALSCTATVRNAAGTTDAPAAPVFLPPVVGAPLTTSILPQLRASGVPSTPGSTLTCSVPLAPGYAAVSIAWERDGVLDGSRKGAMIVLDDADVGRVLACRVAFTTLAGVTTERSLATLVLPWQAPSGTQPAVLPTLDVTPTQGDAVTCFGGGDSLATRVVRTWLLDGKPLATSGAVPYAPRARDVGHLLSCQSRTTGIAGVEIVESRPIRVRAAGHPVLYRAPQIRRTMLGSGGIAVDTVLTCAPGTWSGATTVAATIWLREGTIVASGSTYQATAADAGRSLACAVTVVGTSPSDQVTATSEQVTVGLAPYGAPVATDVLVAGDRFVGGEVRCVSVWQIAPHGVAIAWLRDRKLIAGTGRARPVAVADAGHTLSCRVTASNAAGSVMVPSTASIPVAALVTRPSLVGRATTAGSARVGETLRCLATWHRAPSVSYAWLRAGKRIARAISTTYRLTRADRGSAVACRATAWNTAGTTAATSGSRKVR